MAAGQKTFEYAVRDKKGSIVTGRIEALDQTAVVKRLGTMGLTPLSVTEVSQDGLSREIKIPGMSDRISLKDLSISTRQMATMVSAGLSLIRTLTIIAEQTDNQALGKLYAQVRADVETGASMSSALRKHPRTFPPLMINMVRAGETGGFLEDALVSVAENFEAEVKLRGQIKSAMAYPVVVLCIAVLAVVGMLLFIVPVFEGMFADFGGELPWATQILVTMSEAMVWVLPLLIVAGVAFAIWWSRHKNDDKVRQFLDPIKLKLPVFGVVIQKIALARFTRNFSTMVGAGVPLLQALDIVGETSGNYVIQKAIQDVQTSVRNGQTLAGPLANHPVFPPMVVQMMAVGEDAGALEQMLAKVAEFYDQEVQATTEQLTSLIEPLMIVMIGGIVGGMIVALYMPIFSIFDQMA